MASNANEDKTKRGATKEPAPAKKVPAAKKAAPAKKSAPARKGVPAKKSALARKAAPARPAGKGGPEDALPPVEGELVIGKGDGRLSIRVDGEDVAIEDLADLGKAELSLHIDLRKSQLLATGEHAKLLKLLADFLDKRAMAGIFGGVTTCRKPPGK